MVRVSGFWYSVEAHNTGPIKAQGAVEIYDRKIIKLWFIIYADDWGWSDSSGICRAILAHLSVKGRGSAPPLKRRNVDAVTLESNSNSPPSSMSHIGDSLARHLWHCFFHLWSLVLTLGPWIFDLWSWLSLGRDRVAPLSPRTCIVMAHRFASTRDKNILTSIFTHLPCTLDSQHWLRMRLRFQHVTAVSANNGLCVCKGLQSTRFTQSRFTP